MVSYAEKRDSLGRAQSVAQEALRVGALTAIDIGAHEGVFVDSLSNAGIHVAAIDKDPRPNTIQQTVTADNVSKLSRVDVVLALSVLHHMADWREVLAGLRDVARKLLVVEVPNPVERLHKAAARDELLELYSVVRGAATHAIYSSPSVYDPLVKRLIWVIPPLISGVVFSGSGNHARTQHLYGDKFAETLDYLPYPGSLNIQLDHPPDLGEPQLTVSPNSRRHYQLWSARLGNVFGHLMIPDRPHPNSVEMLAPVKLRDQGIEDGNHLSIEVIW